MEPVMEQKNKNRTGSRTEFKIVLVMVHAMAHAMEQKNKNRTGSRTEFKIVLVMVHAISKLYL
jgi:preprotein translocase subunit SecE